MSALYFEALRCLPEHLVNDSTQAIQHGDIVLVVNPHHPAMIYTKNFPEWKEIEITEIPPPTEE